MNDNDKKKKRKKTLLILLVLLLLLIIGIIISFSIAGTDSQNGGGLNPSSQSSPGSSSLDDNGSAIPGGYDSKTQSEILSELQKKQLTVTDRVSAQISFPSGAKGTKGAWVVENPALNNVIMQCEVVLDGKTVAKSVPIVPGQHIESITLVKKIDPGTYDVNAAIRYYDRDTKTYLGEANYRIKLTVS
ncbi:hypothetical protein [Faecalispora anaeroviscerum]|uniref:hypothetical protein n=1 Tax=Faecalispora anaeroviscerum TaxID=2991836 RepID=UPI0024BB0EDF|nr:hypothetical protein [Faecalispora anaeroviscerum]